MRRVLSMCAALAVMLSVAVDAVAIEEPKEFPKTGLKWTFGEQDEHQLSFAIIGQFWARMIENNPGTLNSAGEREATTWDMGMRRMRFASKYTYNDELTIYAQFGTNNMTFNNSVTTAKSAAARPTLFIHDFFGMYKVTDRKLYIGAGLNAFSGVSRYSNCASFTYLALDNPLVNWAGINRNDQFYRQLGVFAMGTVGRLGYRVALAKPFAFGLTAKEMEADGAKYVDRAVDLKSAKMSAKGYAFWQFGDVIHSTTPFLSMGYLGKKKVYNIGAGFNYYPEATASTVKEGTSYKADKSAKFQLGLDAFVEQPFGKGASLTWYGVFYHYDLGKNYLRSAGIMNVASGQTPDAKSQYGQGSGNRYYVIGTGNVVLTEMGVLLPENVSLGNTRLQPFGRFTYQDFDAFADAGTIYDMGMNFLVLGNKLKLSVQYTLRPIFKGLQSNGDKLSLEEHRGMGIFQFQFRI